LLLHQDVEEVEEGLGEVVDIELDDFLLVTVTIEGNGWKEICEEGDDSL
jgi:hypothetical protein